LFAIGVGILAIAELQKVKTEQELTAPGAQRKGDWRVVVFPLLEHLASALIVAAVMGVSYEYFVHKHAVNDFADLLEEHEKATESAFNAFRATTARDVFTLLGNIAEHTPKIPTLFDPPRESSNEIVFSTDEHFFQRLVGSDNARAEAIEVIEQWINSQSLQLQFLGGDLIGLLFLKELAQRTREVAAERQMSWKSLTEIERGCVLNLWWAASRCEDPMYLLLRTRLIEWDDPFVQKWILFVPRQMPDARLGRMIQLFLRTRGSTARKDVLEATIAAIEALHHTGFNMRWTVNRHRAVFEAAALWKEACAAVSAVPAAVQQSWIARAKRFFKRE